MMATCTESGPEPSLRPELARLVDVGVLERAMVGDGARDAVGAFDELVRAATAAGIVTVEQASALAALLGLGAPLPANDCRPRPSQDPPAQSRAGVP